MKFQRQSPVSALQRTLFLLALILGIGVVSQAQQYGSWNGASLASICGPNDTYIYQYSFTGGAIQTNQSAEIWLVKVDLSPYSRTPIQQVLTVASTNQWPVNNIYLDVTFTENTVSFVSNSPNTTSNGSSVNLGYLQEGYYEFEARVKQGGNTVQTWTAPVPLGYWRGAWPSSVQINNDFSKKVILYEDCAAEVLLESNLCGSNYSLMVREIDPVTGAIVSTTDAFRNLTASEVNALGGNGLNIKTWSGNNTTITMTAGKTYQVVITNTAYGGWKSTGRWVQMKAGGWDLAMRDNFFDDDGYEPWDQWSGDLFKSPDLWNKLSTSSNPNNGSNEEPDYSTNPNNTNKMMVSITNIGCETSPEDVPLTLFWTRARVGELWDSHWRATQTNRVSIAGGGTYQAGSEITIQNPTPSNPVSLNSDPFLIPAIAPGQTWTMDFANDAVDWYAPNPIYYNASNGGMAGSLQRPEICFLARINEGNSAEDPITHEPTGNQNHIAGYVRNNNNVVTRNTILYDNPQFIIGPGDESWNYGFVTVLVDNTTEEEETVSICVEQLSTGLDNSMDFLEFGSIEVGMTEGLWELWANGGYASENLDVVDETMFELEASEGACLSSITLEPGASEVLGVRVNAHGQSFPGEEVPMLYEINMSYGDGSAGSSNLIEFTMPSSSPLEGKRGTASVEETTKSQIRIFPNPAQDQIHVYYGSPEESTVMDFDLKVFNMSGQVVLAKQALKMNQQVPLDVQGLGAGVYLVEFHAGAEVTTQRLVIK